MKLRTLFSILSIFICSVQVTAQHADQTHDANRARAVALWEEVIRAKGGRERLHAVENVLIVSKVNSSTLPQFNPRATRRLFVLPDRAWLQGSVSGSQVNIEVVVTSIKQRRCQMKPSQTELVLPGPLACSFPESSSYLMRDPMTYLLETKWTKPTILGARVEGSRSNRVEIVEVELTRLLMDFYLDSKTRLPFKLVIKESEATSRLDAHPKTTIKFSDYASFDGIQMPRSIKRETEPHRWAMPERETEMAQYSFNLMYDDSLFDERTP